MLGDRADDTALVALGQGDHVLEGLVGEDLAERRTDRGERERVAGERAADAADVGRVPDGVLENPLGDLVREPVRAGRDAAADRLAHA